jgi:hypothetical protein
LIYKTHIHCDWRLLPLDPAFFLSAPPPPLVSKSQDLVANEFAAKANFVVVAHNRKTLRLGVQIDELENEGDLETEWQVTLPNQKQIQSHLTTIELPRAPGFYKIRLNLGQSIVIERTLKFE